MSSTEFTHLIACVFGVLIVLGVLYAALKLWLDAPKKFKGLFIPEGLTPNTVDLAFHGGRCCHAGKGVKCPHKHVGDCNKCLCLSDHRDELLEWMGKNKNINEVKEKEMFTSEKMPELQFGDVVKWDDGPYGIVGNTDVHFLTNKDGIMSITGVSRSKTAVENIIKVFRSSNGEGFRQGELYRIYTGLAAGFVIWERPEVREMTVDQISKELGYTVKVIGNDVGR
jgi:hypothetical protein